MMLLWKRKVGSISSTKFMHDRGAFVRDGLDTILA